MEREREKKLNKCLRSESELTRGHGRDVTLGLTAPIGQHLAKRAKHSTWQKISVVKKGARHVASADHGERSRGKSCSSVRATNPKALFRIKNSVRLLARNCFSLSLVHQLPLKLLTLLACLEASKLQLNQRSTFTFISLQLPMSADTTDEHDITRDTILRR